MDLTYAAFTPAQLDARNMLRATRNLLRATSIKLRNLRKLVQTGANAALDSPLARRHVY